MLNNEGDQNNNQGEEKFELKCELSLNSLRIAKELQDQLTIRVRENQKDLLEITPFTVKDSRMSLSKDPNYINVVKKDNGLSLSFVWKDREILNQDIQIPLEDLQEKMHFEQDIDLNQNIDLDIFEKNLNASLKLKWVNTEKVGQVKEELAEFDFENFRKSQEQKRLDKQMKEIEKVESAKMAKAKKVRTKQLEEMKKKKELRKSTKGRKKLKKTSTAEKLLKSGPIGAKAKPRVKKTKTVTQNSRKVRKNMSKERITTRSKDRIRRKSKDKKSSVAESHAKINDEHIKVENYLDDVVKKNSKRQPKGPIKDQHSFALNKFNKIKNRDLINSGVLGGIQGQSVTQIEVDPEILRKRYSQKGYNNSPSKNSKPDMTSLMMDKEGRRYVNEYKSQIEYLRGIIYSMDLQITGENILKDQNKLLEEAISKSEAAREQLRKTMLESTQEMKSQVAKFKGIIEEMKVSENETKLENQNLREENRVLKGKISTLERRNSILEHDFNELKVNNNANMIYEELLRETKRELKQSQKANLSIVNNLSLDLENLNLKIIKITEEKNTISKELENYEQKNLVLSQQLLEQKSKARNLKSENDTLCAQMEVFKGRDALDNSLKTQKALNEKILTKIAKDNDTFLDKMSDLKAHIINQSQKDLKMNLTSVEKIELLSKKIDNLNKDIDTLRQDKQSLEKRNSELVEHTMTLEQLLCVKEDVFSQVSNSKDMVNQANNSVKKLEAEIEGNVKVLEYDAEKIFELEKMITYLQNITNEKNEVKKSKVTFFLVH